MWAACQARAGTHRAASSPRPLPTRPFCTVCFTLNPHLPRPLSTPQLAGYVLGMGGPQPAPRARRAGCCIESRRGPALWRSLIVSSRQPRFTQEETEAGGGGVLSWGTQGQTPTRSASQAPLLNPKAVQLLACPRRAAPRSHSLSFGAPTHRHPPRGPAAHAGFSLCRPEAPVCHQPPDLPGSALGGHRPGGHRAAAGASAGRHP